MPETAAVVILNECRRVLSASVYRICCLSILRWRNQREKNGEAGAFAGEGVASDVAAVVGDDAVTDAQAQARSLSLRLGGEKRIEDSVSDGGWNSCARVFHPDFHAAVGGAGSDADFAAILAGVNGVGEDVENDLVDARGVAGDSRDRRQSISSSTPWLRGLAANDIDRRGDSRIQFGTRLDGTDRLLPGEFAQIANDLLDTAQTISRAKKRVVQIFQNIDDVDPLGGVANLREGGRIGAVPAPSSAARYSSSRPLTSAKSRWRIATLLVTNASGLLTSCATPATRLPNAASFSDCKHPGLRLA